MRALLTNRHAVPACVGCVDTGSPSAAPLSYRPASPRRVPSILFRGASNLDPSEVYTASASASPRFGEISGLREALEGRPPTVADLRNLTYTGMVLDEPMRLYPPVWAVGRSPIEDDEALRAAVLRLISIPGTHPPSQVGSTPIARVFPRKPWSVSIQPSNPARQFPEMRSITYV